MNEIISVVMETHALILSGEPKGYGWLLGTLVGVFYVTAAYMLWGLISSVFSRDIWHFINRVEQVSIFFGLVAAIRCRETETPRHGDRESSRSSGICRNRRAHLRDQRSCNGVSGLRRGDERVRRSARSGEPRGAHEGLPRVRRDNHTERVCVPVPT